MNRFPLITASLFAAVCSTQSFASPVAYTFTAPILASETALFDSSASISGTFYYDAATAASAVNQVPTDLGPTGLYSQYQGAIQNLSATVGGYSFSAISGDTLVGDASGDSGLDAVFIRAGQGSGFSGFTVSGYTLVGFDLYTFDLSSTFDSQALPSTLVNGLIATAVNLTFENASHEQVHVEFGMGDIQVSEVPLPASAWLFGSAALVLKGRKRRA